VARDRKRAKQRRDRQARSGAAPARRAEGPLAPARDPESHEHEAPELASGEVDLADAQLALGRPELANGDANGTPDATAVPDVEEDPAELPELADEARFERLEDAVDEAEADFEEQRGESENGHAAEVARRPKRAPAAVRPEGNRFATFLRGSWRELQRVQWPDRRQVAQATAVVIGFLIVAGAFLGLMDLLASKIVDLII
jgi:preprotein translocase subunit SecE